MSPPKSGSLPITICSSVTPPPLLSANAAINFLKLLVVLFVIVTVLKPFGLPSCFRWTSSPTMPVTRSGCMDLMLLGVLVKGKRSSKGVEIGVKNRLRRMT
ncbi:hypothetical protein RHSIM_Rhsim05G0008300 [Rhododendron simsii]|uniref:Uncharacterized protein n=1 Tax=Rhododendron simsii TaxID=118357 RepID=A0A834LP67_RHOSS|nr:hypothetical protein RHSIM_Rhsim05G0008300 [Rhododendron simsii]